MVQGGQIVPKGYAAGRMHTTQLHGQVAQHLVEDISNSPSTALELREQERVLRAVDGYVHATTHLCQDQRNGGLIGMNDNQVGFFAAHAIEGQIRSMLAAKAQECNVSGQVQTRQRQEYHTLIAHVVGNLGGTQHFDRRESDIVRFLDFVDFHLQAAGITVMLSSIFQSSMTASPRSNPEQVLRNLYISHIPSGLL